MIDEYLDFSKVSRWIHEFVEHDNCVFEEGQIVTLVEMTHWMCGNLESLTRAIRVAFGSPIRSRRASLVTFGFWYLEKEVGNRSPWPRAFSRASAAVVLSEFSTIERTVCYSWWLFNDVPDSPLTPLPRPKLRSTIKPRPRTPR